MRESKKVLDDVKEYVGKPGQFVQIYVHIHKRRKLIVMVSDGPMKLSRSKKWGWMSLEELCPVKDEAAYSYNT